MYMSSESHASLSTITASPGPSPKARYLEKTFMMPALLASISASPSRGRASSRNEGSPILVVPPPIRTMGLWPQRCMRRSSMIETMLPTWRLGAVQSNPM